MGDVPAIVQGVVTAAGIAKELYDDLPQSVQDKIQSGVQNVEHDIMYEYEKVEKRFVDSIERFRNQGRHDLAARKTVHLKNLRKRMAHEMSGERYPQATLEQAGLYGHKKRRRIVRGKGYIPATKTIAMVDDGYAAHLSNYNLSDMPYTRSMSRRGKRRRAKSSGYVTKRGVKQMINRYGALAGTYNKHVHSQDVYLGNSAAGVPTETYGEVYRNSIETLKQADIAALRDGFFEKLTALPTTGGAGEPSLESLALIVKNMRYKFCFHNPMNEMVRATFWWLKTQSPNSVAPDTLWNNSYIARRIDTTTWAQNFETFPTEFDEFNQFYKIMKKTKAIFHPGETKMLYTKARGFRWVEEDEQTSTYQPPYSYFLLVELKGVPTHQNDNAGTQSTEINYTPVALDCIWNRVIVGGLASTVGSQVDYDNTRGTVSAAVSYLPENVAVIDSK